MINVDYYQDKLLEKVQNKKGVFKGVRLCIIIYKLIFC